MLQLAPEDQVLGYGELGNFSVAGFEMVLNRSELASFYSNFCNSSRLIKEGCTDYRGNVTKYTSSDSRNECHLTSE